jgi:metal-responsive CopG/Arc/MetJ family transcriptional regulator
MARTTKTITISLPPEMIGQIDFLTKKEGRTRSELLREALRRYAEEQEWKDLIRYGQQQAKKKKIIKDKVEDLIDAIRR